MRTPLRPSVRLGAYAASAALALGGALVAATPAQGVTYDPGPAGEAATWLDGQLDNGLMHNPTFGGFDDYGLSIDTALALADVGGHDAAVQSISDAIAANIGSYIGTGSELYSGSAAKAAVLAQAAGRDPSAFGGVDLVAKVESTVSSTASLVGRLEDKSAYGDYANTLGQSLAARALTRAGSGKAAAVTDFLLEQQCSSGYFRLNFSAKDAADQGCVDGRDAPDTDATAFALVQLDAQTGDPQVAAAVARARSWLVGQQRCDGSFGGGTSTEGSNANSTGLVAWALGDAPASRQAALWLRAHQAHDPVDSANHLSGDRGAIAYDDAGLAAGRAAGITDETSDQWRRSTAQAAPGLSSYSTDPTPALSLTGPSGYRKAGSTVVLRTSGGGAGTVLCLAGSGTSARKVATGTAWAASVRLPAGTGTRAYTVRDPYQHKDTVALRVLGRKQLRVDTSRTRVKRSRSVTAVVRGLAPGEQARVYYGGRLVRTGTATRLGRFSATIRVGRSRGVKRITGYGQFRDIRRGSTTIRVVR